MTIEELKDKKILILGFQQEGLNALKFLRQLFPEKILGIADKLTVEKLKLKEAKRAIRSEKKVRLHLGEQYLESLKDYEVIIKAPGIPPTFPQLLKVKKEGKKITSQTEIFFDNCPGTIIGVTGSKGKSTTTSLIYKVLKTGGVNTRLVGNIGRPALSLLIKAKKKTVFVYELSSHQLFGLKKSPQIAILLNVFPEHGDYYPTFNDYVQAKRNITRHQTSSDYFIYNSSLLLLRKAATLTQAQKMPFSLEPKKDSVCFLKNEFLVWHSGHKEKKIIKTSQIPLLGKFNLLNVMPAIIVGKILKIPPKKIAQAIKNFKPLKHRLEFLGKCRGIVFYDDSISTIPESAIAAIDALSRNVQTILLGGFERQQNFAELAKKILETNIKILVLFPPTGKRIWKEILKQKKQGQALPKHFFVDNMKRAVNLAYQHTQKGKICLLSPASPSFGLFKDYKERGNLFKKYAKKLAKKG